MTDQPLETRARIFDAAANLFADRGFAAVSMREIAEAAGVSKPMLYYYFESKLGLCSALVEDGFHRMTEELAQIISKPVPVIQRLRGIFRLRFRVAREKPKIIKFYMDFAFGPDESGIREKFEAKHAVAIRLLTELIAEGQRSGEIRADLAPRGVVMAFTGMLSIFVFTYIRQGAPVPDDALADELLTLFVDGTRNRSAGDSCEPGAVARG